MKTERSTLVCHKILLCPILLGSMNRRKFLSATALSISLPGCIGDGGGTAESDSPTANPAETEHSKATATETEEPSPEVATPACGRSMCEGTKLADVVVSNGFSSDVLFELNCRSEDFSIQPGGSVEVVREEDGETCRISLSVGGEELYSEIIQDHERVSLTVDSNGEVDEEWVVS